ncbi:MAG: DegQ family serine endoprotease [Burkholderiales bacterium]
MRRTASVFLAAAVAALGAGTTLPGVISTAHADVAARAAPAGPRATAVPLAQLPDFSQLVARYGAAVVNITVDEKVAAAQAVPQLPFDEDDPFFQFFRRFALPQPRGDVPVHGMGSGFIVSPDGYILTNAHVVANATDVTVKLSDRREFKARVVGADQRTDVALLKIDARDLPAVKLGDPKAVKPGEWVVAIGSPFGLENTVTAGVVSATGRALPDSDYVPFIQTDVAVNPGNSGGPLFNLAGEVIGINSQIFTRSGGYQGISFAIPIDVALDVERQLIAHGRVIRGRLGVTTQEMSQPLADSFGMKSATGALVSSVEKGSPAERAGLESGDVILEVDGHPVEHAGELARRIAETAPGTRANLVVWRHGSTRDLTAVIGEAKNAQVAAASGAGAEGHGRLGVAVRPLTAAEREQNGGRNGLLVEEASGPAARAGIEAGDVILAVNGQPVTSAAELRRMIGKSGKTIALLIEHGDAQLYVPVTVG